MKTTWAQPPQPPKGRSTSRPIDLRERDDVSLRVLVLSSDYFMDLWGRYGEDKLFVHVNRFYTYTFEQLRILLVALAEKEEDEK